MKVQFVAQNPEQVRAFLCEEAGVNFVDSIRITNQVRRWHDDVWEDVNYRADLGDIWPVYTADLSDNCQDHIKEFSEYQKLDDNYLFILSRKFCASCEFIPNYNSSRRKTEYIIA